MVIAFDTKASEADAIRFDNYLEQNGYNFKRSNIATDFYRYRVVINESMDAFWIGCNLISITNGLL